MSSDRQPSLLTQRKFLPYFITQFFGAFNDNIFKNVFAAVCRLRGIQRTTYFEQLVHQFSGWLVHSTVLSILRFSWRISR